MNRLGVLSIANRLLTLTITLSKVESIYVELFTQPSRIIDHLTLIANKNLSLKLDFNPRSSLIRILDPMNVHELLALPYLTYKVCFYQLLSLLFQCSSSYNCLICLGKLSSIYMNLNLSNYQSTLDQCSKTTLAPLECSSSCNPLDILYDPSLIYLDLQVIECAILAMLSSFITWPWEPISFLSSICVTIVIAYSNTRIKSKNKV